METTLRGFTGSEMSLVNMDTLDLIQSLLLEIRQLKTYSLSSEIYYRILGENYHATQNCV
jgi:hypothetical protein